MPAGAGTTEHHFASFEDTVDGLVGCIHRFLKAQIESAGVASLAVGGGTTPKHVFPRLAATALAWPSVHVSLTDERWVPPENSESNEQLVRRDLLVDRAARANFNGMYVADNGPAESNQDFLTRLADTPWPPDVVYLGFGADSHVASLFPQGPELSANHIGVVASTAPAPPTSRISLTLPAILSSKSIVICVSGPSKHEAYHRAKSDGSARDLPLARILHQDRAPVHVFIDTE